MKISHAVYSAVLIVAIIAISVSGCVSPIQKQACHEFSWHWWCQERGLE